MVLRAVRTKERRVVVIPEAGPPRRRRPLVALGAAALAGLLLGGGAVFAIQQGRLDDREAAVAAARRAALEAEAREVAVSERVIELGERIGSLEGEVSSLRLGLRIVGASKREARRLAEGLQEQLGGARGQLRVWIGPPLADGRHVAMVVAVGPSQAPPRLVLDTVRWLTGRRARRAAIADGVIGPGERLPGNHYVRNPGPTWRVVEISTWATVTLRTWGPRGASVTVGLSEFEDIFGRRSARSVRVVRDPFVVRVEDGVVVGVRQRPYP